MTNEFDELKKAAEECGEENFKILAYHKGFLCDGPFPFQTPLIYPGNITIWPPVDIHPSAKIGKDVVIGRYTNIMGDVSIGDGSRIQGHCYIPDCVAIGKKVFIGPGVIFTNVKYPSVRGSDAMKVRDGVIVIENGASIGAGAILCPNVTIREGTLIGAGAVVTKDTLAESIVVGVPAREFRKED